MMFWDQIKKNLIAILSLAIATTSLGYVTWRNEHTERNRNIRIAAFDVLRELGELQTLVHYAYYEKNSEVGNPITGWGRILLVKDLAMVMPSPMPEKAELLFKTWQENFQNMGTQEKSAQAILEAIQETRQSQLAVIGSLR